MKIWVDGSNKKVGYITEDGFSEIFDADGTNNENELKAIKLALIYALAEGMKNIHILSDSQLAVNQLNHNWHIKDSKLRRLAQDIWKFEKDFDQLRLSWIPREENRAGKLLG